jgi:chaperonin GroES
LRLALNKSIGSAIALALRMRECHLTAITLSALALHRSDIAGEDLMKFRPLGDRVVVRRLAEDQKSSGGIIIPDTAQEKPQEGQIVSAGPGAIDERGKRVPLEVKAGDFVLFGKWTGSEVKIGGEELVVMKESDIMGVLEGRNAKSIKKVA